ncbi:SIMPL domain-containing protein [Mannheimia pernigra]|uniref:SIMPL domain-containing protein n=1 Tax=Mannheimia pernigra TaxID=111844 RepID=A0ABD7A5N0_9PAST|nr:SIMPL domain-containing protein [Mannheimia pernigra]QLB41428.1 SIMPL domain-containing protein [Mannheimia pernigra]
MTLKNFLTILPLVLATATTFAQTVTPEAAAVSAENKDKPATFHFSTEVFRTVEKDLMQANVYSQKSGKSLPNLKKEVAQHLNRVLEEAKKYPSIEVEAEGVINYANYNGKGNIDGWETTGSIHLKSKDFDAMAAVLESVSKDVAIRYVDFSVSPEKKASLEDEMTLEIIKKFQHKADIIQKGLGAKKYKLSNINIQTPDESGGQYYQHRLAYDSAEYAVKQAAIGKSAKALPLEAGKTTIYASASGNVEFE